LNLMKTQKQLIEQQSSCNSLNATETSSERLNGLKTSSFVGFSTHNNAGSDQLLLLSAKSPLYYRFTCHDNPLNVLPIHGVGQYTSVQDNFKRPMITQLSELSSAGLSASRHADMSGMHLLDCGNKVLPMSQFLHVPLGQHSDAVSNTLFGQHSQTLLKVHNGLNSTAFADSIGMQLSDHSSKALPTGQSLHVPFGHNMGAFSDAYGQHSHTLSYFKNDPSSKDTGAVKKSLFSPK
jgi:hypothetical protein